MHCLPRPAAPVNQKFPFVVADWMSLILITEGEPLRENGIQMKNVSLENKKTFPIAHLGLTFIAMKMEVFWFCLFCSVFRLIYLTVYCYFCLNKLLFFFLLIGLYAGCSV